MEILYKDVEVDTSGLFVQFFSIFCASGGMKSKQNIDEYVFLTKFFSLKSWKNNIWNFLFLMLEVS